MFRMMVVLLATASIAVADDQPMSVDQFLAQGELAGGELTLEARLNEHADDDQARFGLGVIQLVRGVERLGQALYEYGAKARGEYSIRLPVPENKDPAPINALRLRRIMDDFRRDLLRAELTLSKITSDDVQLRLHLADILLDLDSDGVATDKFGEILQRSFRDNWSGLLEQNPGFEVNFDRSDVAWLRAYCHLLASIVDGMLCVLDEPQFEIWAHQSFAKPVHVFQGDQEERWKRSQRLAKESSPKEPLRLRRVREHWIRVTELNEETWKYIRQETDNDHEWLPNPQQTGVMRLPVRDELIDAWLAMMAELRRLVEGERVIRLDGKKNGKGLNLKLYLDDPPLDPPGEEGIPSKYFTEGKSVNSAVFWAIVQWLFDPDLVGYPIWFN